MGRCPQRTLNNQHKKSKRLERGGQMRTKRRGKYYCAHVHRCVAVCQPMNVRARERAQRVCTGGMLVAGVIVALVDILAWKAARVGIAVVAPASRIGKKKKKKQEHRQGAGRKSGSRMAARRLASYERALSPRNVHVAAWSVPQPPLLLAQ